MQVGCKPVPAKYALRKDVKACLGCFSKLLDEVAFERGGASRLPNMPMFVYDDFAGGVFVVEMRGFLGDSQILVRRYSLSIRFK